MTIQKRLVTMLMLVGFSLIPANAARADSAGEPGKIAGFEHDDDSSDEIQVGVLYVDYGGPSLRQYKWGGSWCPGRDLDISQQALLLDGMRGKLAVLPYYKIGNGGARCLVAFKFAAKKSYVDEIAN